MFARSISPEVNWAVCLLVCGVVFSLPRIVEATCGDYLDLPEHATHRTAPLLNDRPLDPPQRPCRGPNCQRSTPPAAPSAPFSIQRITDQWACASGAAWNLPPQSQPQATAPGASGADGHPLRIERPPR